MNEEEYTAEEEVGQTRESSITEPPVIRKKRGRPKGWKKAEFKPIPTEPDKDEMAMLKEELQTLRNQMSKMRGYQTDQIFIPEN